MRVCAYTNSGIEISLTEVCEDNVPKLWVREVHPDGNISMSSFQSVLNNPKQRAFYWAAVKATVRGWFGLRR